MMSPTQKLHTIIKMMPTTTRMPPRPIPPVLPPVRSAIGLPPRRLRPAPRACRASGLSIPLIPARESFPCSRQREVPLKRRVPHRGRRDSPPSRREELYPNVVDGRDEEGGVPSRLIKTDRRKAERKARHGGCSQAPRRGGRGDRGHAG